ncbi:MAG TPA: MupA/Atu3671 family FMN-dependent luciferase-like monooxygenase [Thermoanaerobaculia bacterium]|nr:MupA/Atu3671 family FMN-dependent luciferase-like monooxygenase [Thermoanaerobaculia bacterium]
MERATFTNSGTEAVMTAIRLARAKTGRTRIAMFAGSYHGHSDGTLAQTQEVNGELRSFPVAPGIPAKVAEEVLVLDYGTPEALEILRKYRHELAAVIVEPIQSRRPDFAPREFLHELRKLTAESGVALIFDEMICGFRLHLGGGQAYFGVRADLATYGKIVGGGFPIGVVAGSAEYMDGIDGGFWRYGDDSRPERDTTFFGGTFCQHPLAMAAARTVLQELKRQGPGLQEDLNARTARFAAGLNDLFTGEKVPLRAVHAHSIFRFNLSAGADLLFYHLVEKGVYVWEWRNCFLSTAHTDADLEFVTRAVEESVHELRKGGFLPEKPPEPGGGKKGFWEREGKPAIAPVEAAAAAEPTADREVQFSLYFFGNYGAEFRSDKYDLFFECARFADRHGFSALWFPERHFHPFGGLSPNPSVLAAALARETERIALRAGSVVLPLHHPVRVAEEWALVDNLSGGRIGLSYASGWHPNDFALAPENYGDHRELMFERIEIVRRLWRGESLRVKDGAGKEVDVRIYPLPARRDLPGWITIVNNADTYRRAGEIGAGVLTNLMGQTVEGLAEAVRTYREALARAGHPPAAGHVTLLLHAFVEEDAESAIARARRPFYSYLRSSVGLLRNMMASEGIDVDFDRLSEDDLEYMLELAYQRYVKTSALIGSPETCAPIVERLRAIGVDEIACLVDFGVDRESVVASLPWLEALKDRFRGERAVFSAGPIEVPLTEAQSDLFTVAMMGEEALMAYNEAGVVELSGPLDLPALERALQGEVDRHEALRTVFPPSGETQVVLPPFAVRLPVIDVSGLPTDRREDAVSLWLDTQARHPFDLARLPLLRASAVRMEKRLHLFSVAVHHIAADGLSIGLFLGETFSAYEAMRAGLRPAFPPPFQFREYAAWLAERGVSAEDEAYWLGRFEGPLPVFEPPTDRPRPPVVTFHGRRQRRVFSPEFRRRVHQFGRKNGATFYITLLAAWAAVLHRWAGQDDLVIGGPTARRPLEGGDRLVGHCVDLVALRSRLDLLGPLPAFARHMAAVRSLVLEAHDHGDYSFSRLVRTLNPPRDPSRPALVNTVFNLEPDWAMDKVGGLAVAERSPAIPYVKFDLALHALESGGALVIYLDVRSDLFDPGTIERLFGYLENALEGVMEDAGRPLSTLPLLSAPEREQLLLKMAGPATGYPRERTVPELFREVAAAAPDAVALEFGDERVSYAELADRAESWARSLGIAPGGRVAVAFGRSPGLVTAMLAALEAGGAYVPVDPAWPEERIAAILADAAPGAILTAPEDREALERAAARAGIGAPVLTEPGEAAERDVLAGTAGPDDLACLIYTSGSTGAPKGVAVPHRGIVRLVRDTDYIRLTPEDRVAHASHPAFDATTFEVWGPLLNGARVVGFDREVVLSPADFAAEIRAREVSVLFLTTALFNQVVREEPGAFASVRHLLFGGEAADPDRVREALAAGAPGRLLHVYGPTESTTFATWHPVAAVPEDATTVPIGRPIANTRAVVLDRAGEPVPPGAHGELCLGGDGLARGYLGRPDLTAERFVPDLTADLRGEPGARLYRTGDRVRLRPDGALEFLGRLDDQVKIRGFRVEPGEIEAVLARCPGVRECVVAVREERGERRLVAYAAVEEGMAPDLRAYLRERLPDAMVPSAFVLLPSLPITSGGKVDRRALPAPEPDEGSGRDFEAPRTPVEEIVAGVWAEVLGREERIGAKDDFFDIGGHSLLAGRVLARLQSALGVRLPLREFFKDSTVAGLARRLERARQERGGAVPPPLVRVPRDRRLRLSFGQERIWLAEQLQRGTGAYNSFFPGWMRGRVDFPVLERVLREIQRRHEVLRTAYVAGADGPVQAIAPASSLASWRLPVVDLSALLEEERKAELRRLSSDESLRPFDLAKGPLLCPTLLKLAPEEHVLFLDLHHSVCDGWSFDVLVRELAALYRAFSAGRPSPLPDLPIQYADFAQWQRQWLQGEVFDSQLAWWRHQLGEKPPVLDLPTDRPRPPVQSARGANAPFSLPPELAAGLQELARRSGSTLFTVLLAAFQVLLHRWSGQERVSVGTPVAGRSRVEVEGLIGFFINTLVLSSDLGGDPTVPELLDRAREVTLGAFDHQDLPFEKLVAALETERDPSRQPLFQVMLVLQNNRMPDIELPGLTLGIVPAGGGATQFDLVLSLMETGSGLEGVLSYGTDLFEASTAGLLVEDFRRVLEALTEGSGRLSEIPRLAGEERREARASAPAVAAPAVPEEDAVERRKAELEERRRQLSSRRGQLSPERRALLEKWVGGKAAVPEEAPPKADPLVAIQPEGSRPPIFVVHPGAGVTHDYLTLARELGPEQPFYALQSPGLAGGGLFDSVGEMASRYIEAIRSVQPQGPYRLGGWCTGGVVAFEMARQLLERGEEVDRLLLLDSPAPDPEATVRSDEREMLAGMVRQLAGAGFEVPEEELSGIPVDDWMDRVVELGRERGVLPPSFDAEQARRHWQVVRANVRAVESYVPKGPCEVRSLLFRATEQPEEIGERTSRGWERWLPGPLEIRDVEGDHAAPVREPGAGLVASHLRVRLAAEETAAVGSGI